MVSVVAGAHVVMACRSVERGEAAMNDIRAAIRDGTLAKRDAGGEQVATYGVPHVTGADEVSLEVMALDLSDLASVRSFVDTFVAAHKQLHYLILNAGVCSSSALMCSNR